MQADIGININSRTCIRGCRNEDIGKLFVRCHSKCSRWISDQENLQCHPHQRSFVMQSITINMKIQVRVKIIGVNRICSPDRDISITLSLPKIQIMAEEKAKRVQELELVDDCNEPVFFLPDTVCQLHTWTHSSFESIYKTSTSSIWTKSQHGEEADAQSPNPN